MRLTEIESEIKRRQEIDNKDPEIFNLLKKMIYLYLIRYKITNNSEDADNISLLMAEDMFMKIYNGSLIYAPIRYMAKCKNGYIRIYRKMTDTQIIETNNDKDLYEGIVSMSAGLSNSCKKYNEIDTKESFKSIPNMILDLINKSSRYEDFSSTNLNIFISILLSLNTNSIISIFLSESEYQYFLLLLQKCKDFLRDELTKDLTDEIYDKLLMESFFIDEV